MNKETGEIIKSIIDLFVIREKMLKEILEDKDKEIMKLKKEIDYFQE